ncbi:MAG: membrane protein insertase YidC [Nevskiales bacterium]|nr:membrane protein insertase YidC [Nevskiales bacterium]
MTTIESRRFALLAALGVILFLLYQAWQKDYGHTAPAAAAGTPAPVDAMAPPSAENEVPTVAADTTPALQAVPEIKTGSGQRIRVETDLLIAELSTEGGDLRRVELKGYPYAKKQPELNVALLDDTPERWFVIQSGLAGAKQPVVSHKDLYRTAAAQYTLAEGASRVEVSLEYSNARGQTVVKTYRFERGSYKIELTHTLRNRSNSPVTTGPYVQLWRTPFAAGEEPPFVKSFQGLGFYEQKNGGERYRFRKIAFDDLAEEPVERKQTGGWLAFLQHYFLAAVIPPAGEAATYVGKPSASLGYLAQYLGATQEVPAQSEKTFSTPLYIGPKLQRSLADIAPGLELTVDYGILTPLSEPLFWLLDWFYRLTTNWGAAIILLTLAVKLALFKLSEAQYRSMAKMKKYAPRLQELKERYGDDRQRLQQAMMELYKKEKFNPLAGCWPLLIQFPVFIALYWVLLESVELRQADFVFWLRDLSAPDPYYVLPVLFGLSMWVQQKLSGSVVMDPMQQRIMSLMPAMLTVFFAFFPVGLVLYWLVSNLIGIAQQWYITRKLEREGLHHR